MTSLCGNTGVIKYEDGTRYEVAKLRRAVYGEDAGEMESSVCGEGELEIRSEEVRRNGVAREGTVNAKREVGLGDKSTRS